MDQHALKIKRESYRDALGRAFERLGDDYPDVTVVTADVSKSTRSINFKNKYPERFFSVGIAEANAVGVAAGLSTWGAPVIFTAYSDPTLLRKYLSLPCPSLTTQTAVSCPMQ